MDDILLASSDVDLLQETKKFLSSKFDMKDLGEASFVLEIEIHRDRKNEVLGRYQSNPGIEHWKMVKKVLRYVRGTTGLMLTYRKSESLEIEGYSDAYFAGDADDRKSTSGYISTLAKGAIS